MSTSVEPTGTIHVESEENICEITIENPGKRNAISSKIAAEIRDELSTLEKSDEMKVLILTGKGEKAFSAGADISEFTHQDDSIKLDEEYYERRRQFVRMRNEVRRYDYPTIAMLNGDTVGGAMALAASCDFRIAVEDARFGVPPAKLGSIYGDKGILRLLDSVGPMGTKELLFTGELFGAERLKELGLLTDVVERDELEDRTYELANTISGNAPLSVKGMKKIILAFLEKRTFSDQEKEWVQHMQQEAYNSRDYEEGVKSFNENREPDFVGR